MPFTSVVVPKQLGATTRLVSEVRFAQAAEAAQSVQLKPPKAAIGGNDSDSDGFRRTDKLAAEVIRPHRQPEARAIKFVMFLLFKSRLAAAVVDAGPTGTQRLSRRPVGSGVGAEYAPTPFTAPSQARHAHKLQTRIVAKLTRAPQQHAPSSARATLNKSTSGKPRALNWT